MITSDVKTVNGSGRMASSIVLMPALWIGVFCSLLLAFYVAHWEYQALRNELRELAKDRAQVLYANMRSSTEVLYSLAALHQANGGMDLAHFSHFAQDAVRRHPELQAVEWIPRVSSAARGEYEHRRRAQGFPGFRFSEIGDDGLLTVAAFRAEYFPVYFVEPYLGNAAALGFDLAADSLRLVALEQARDSGLPAVTAPVRLAQETQTQQGFLMFYPIYRGSPPQDVPSRRAQLQGFALAVFRAGDLVATALRDIPERGLSVAIYDSRTVQQTFVPVLAGKGEQVATGREGNGAIEAVTDDLIPPRQAAFAQNMSRVPSLFHKRENASASAPNLNPATRPLAQQLAVNSEPPSWLNTQLATWLGPLQADIVIDVAGHSWRLVFSASPQFAAHRRSNQALVALTVGLMLTALLVAYLANAAKREEEIYQANLALQREITERERAVEVAQAASLAKSDFLANMSHEIRTPLNAVLGYAQLLRADLRLDLQQKDAVKAIIASGNHLLTQINAVLDFSKIETGRMDVRPENLRLNDLLGELELMFRPRCQEKGLILRVQKLAETDAAVGQVYTDGCKLRQILINLLGNAVRFTHSGQVMLGCCAPAPGIYRFDVVDTGPGIPQDALGRIFEPFYQGAWQQQSEGTGLGLAIARRQVQLLGGTLEVVSEVGEGSRFTLVAPLPPATSLQLTHSPLAVGWHLPRELGTAASVRILIVDDLAANRDVLSSLLRNAGCQTQQAETGVDALAALAAAPVDIIFLDIRMPDGGGLTLLRHIRALHPALPVIAYTALAFEQDRQQCLAAGCQGFIAKPVQAEAVFCCLEELLGIQFSRVWDEPVARPLALATLRLPADLYRRLIAAAELHSTTLLKTGLLELEALGGDARRLAEALGNPMRAYDMSAIMHLLVQLPEPLLESSPAATVDISPRDNPARVVFDTVVTTDRLASSCTG